MTRAILSRVCVVAILHDQKLLKSHKAVVAKRTNHSFASWKLRQHHHHRRAKSSPATPLHASGSIRRRRSRPRPLAPVFCCHHALLQQASERLLLAGGIMGKDDAPPRVRRRSFAVERGPLEQSTSLPDDAASVTTAHSMASNPSQPPTRIHHGTRSSQDAHSARSSMCFDRDSPIPGDDVLLTRSSRSTSSASRNTNRLSITLPIAPPTCDPTRPALNSAVSTVPPSFPGTPADTSALASPSDTNEFIIAIAAQERRVMELREELERAEGDLKSLKRQFTMHEASKKAAGDRRHGETVRPLAPKTETRASTPFDDGEPVRRSVDLDRRKQILQGKQGRMPREGHGRRVFTGRHTRTLSLLSPTKTDPGDFSVLEDRDICTSPDLEHRRVPPLPPALNKRSTWQPRSYHPQPGQAGVSQIVEDFKVGFRTFYEDIRQITVGDEPVNGIRSTAVDLNTRGGRTFADDQETIRPAQAPRPRVGTAVFDSPAASAAATTETPTRTRPTTTTITATQRERVNAARKKHFSWTPLSFEDIDGDAWLNFDSPSSSGKPTRWSGSTMNDDNDTVQTTEERKVQETDGTPLRKKSTPLGLPSPSGLTPQKLEELTNQVVNRLSPSNIKRTASDLVKEWEKSMADPPTTTTTTAPVVVSETDDKENVSV